MAFNKNIKILAFVGMAGSGKTTAVNYLADKGFPKIYSGGMLFDEMQQRGLELTPENQRIFREQIRQERGDDYLARLCAEQIHNLISAGQKRLVLDGPYTWPEYRYLKSEFPGSITVVAVVAPRKVRHNRLSKRPDRPFSELQSQERDQSEIEGIEKAGPIAMADHYIDSQGNLEEFYSKIDAITDEVHFCKTPHQC